MRDLVDQERNAYTEEKIRTEDETKQSVGMLETKLKLVRNKILMLLQNFGREEEKQGNLETLPNEEVIKRLADLLQFYKEKDVFFSNIGHHNNHNRMMSKDSANC